MARRTQSRNYCFTRYLTPEEAILLRANPPQAEGQVPIITDLANVNYIIFQFEEGDREHHAHLQGFVNLKGARDPKFVKDLVGNNAHVEVAHDVQASILYCQKTEGRIAGPWTVGRPPKGMGHRFDLESIHEKLKSGCSIPSIIDEDPKSLRYVKMMLFDQSIQLESRSDRQHSGINVRVLWGDAGSGKSQWAINHLVHGSYYKLDCSGVKQGNIWFDGYDGQDTLIIDDFDGDTCQLHFLKNLLDVYKLHLPIKGGFTWACWHYVVITSNEHPADWYFHMPEVHKMALKRRIHTICHCETGYIYRKQNWDKTYIDADFASIPEPPLHPAEAPAQAPPAAVILAEDTQTEDAPTQPLPQRRRLVRTDSVNLNDLF